MLSTGKDQLMPYFLILITFRYAEIMTLLFILLSDIGCLFIILVNNIFIKRSIVGSCICAVVWLVVSSQALIYCISLHEQWDVLLAAYALRYGSCHGKLQKTRTQCNGSFNLTLLFNECTVMKPVIFITISRMPCRNIWPRT